MFSTLHTNDAPSTITRLKDMGVPTFLITATVEAILAQRLVRKVCMQCREEYTPPREILDDLELTCEQVRGKRFYRGAGCEMCNNTGYKGRVGLFELMIMNNDLRDMIMANAQTDELRDAGPQAGHGAAPRRPASSAASTASPRRTKWCEKQFWKRREKLSAVSCQLSVRRIG